MIHIEHKANSELAHLHFLINIIPIANLSVFWGITSAVSEVLLAIGSAYNANV